MRKKRAARRDDRKIPYFTVHRTYPGVMSPRCV